MKSIDRSMFLVNSDGARIIERDGVVSTSSEEQCKNLKVQTKHDEAVTLDGNTDVDVPVLSRVEPSG